MTDIISTPRAAPYQSDDFAARLRKRYAAERRFKLYGVAAIGIALGMLARRSASIVSKGYTAFAQHDMALEIYFDPAEIDPQGTRDPAVLSGANYAALARQSIRRYAKRQGTWFRHQLAPAHGCHVISAQYSESLKPTVCNIIRKMG